MTDEPVRASVTLSAPASHAFAVFAERIGEWWPRPYAYRQEDRAIDPVAGGRWYEVDRSGRRLGWGEVRAFDPRRRLVLTWAVRADRRPEPLDRASEGGDSIPGEGAAGDARRPRAPQLRAPRGGGPSPAARRGIAGRLAVHPQRLRTRGEPDGARRPLRLNAPHARFPLDGRLRRPPRAFKCVAVESSLMLVGPHGRSQHRRIEHQAVSR